MHEIQDANLSNTNAAAVQCEKFFAHQNNKLVATTCRLRQFNFAIEYHNFEIEFPRPKTEKIKSAKER